jgi:hypothetical protein
VDKLPVKIFTNVRYTIYLVMLMILIHDSMAQETEDNYDQLLQGLVGILYDDTELSRPLSLWNIDILDSREADWEKRNDFSARWQGMIKSQHTGKVTFIGEVDNGVLMRIGGVKVLDTWKDALADKGSIDMEEGKFYPIELAYRQINGSSYMRLFWQWNDNPQKIIPHNAIWFSKADESQIQDIYEKALAIPYQELEFDIASIMEIETRNDILNKRQNLTKLLFGSEGLPLQRLPDSLHQNIKDADFQSLENLQRIDKLTIESEWNLNSIVYHFIPEKSADKAIIYHQGHTGKFVNGISTIQAFLNKGFDVIALSMPLKGLNRMPIVNFPRFGKMKIVSHEQMSFLAPSSGHPVRFFLDPVIIVLNYLENLNFNRMMMIGISGGGWTTTLCAALDTRISKSFPVAGSLPFYLRSRDMHNKSTFGDYEQYVPEIYRIANYLDLYIMGAYGEGRQQLQILNQYDSCCFGGTGYTTYIDLIKATIEKLGKGEFDVFLDSSHKEHKISELALDTIFKDLRLE